MDENHTCPDTGMTHEDCPCAWCFPPRFYFKQMITEYDCSDISCVISALKERLRFFQKLKRDGFKLLAPIDDHYADFEPPESESVYWVTCRSSGCLVEIPSGIPAPATCPECGKNLLEYEGK